MLVCSKGASSVPAGGDPKGLVGVEEHRFRRVNPGPSGGHGSRTGFQAQVIYEFRRPAAAAGRQTYSAACEQVYNDSDARVQCRVADRLVALPLISANSAGGGRSGDSAVAGLGHRGIYFAESGSKPPISSRSAGVFNKSGGVLTAGAHAHLGGRLHSLRPGGELETAGHGQCGSCAGMGRDPGRNDLQRPSWNGPNVTVVAWRIGSRLDSLCPRTPWTTSLAVLSRTEDVRLRSGSDESSTVR